MTEFAHSARPALAADKLLLENIIKHIVNDKNINGIIKFFILII